MIVIAVRAHKPPIGIPSASLDHHCANRTCVDPARWLDEAIRLTVHTRQGTAEVPDLPASAG
jgi:hypothetical protein